MQCRRCYRVVLRVGAGHSAILVDRGRDQSALARTDAAGFPSSAQSGVRTPSEHEDSSPEPGRAEGCQREAAPRSVSVGTRAERSAVQQGVPLALGMQEGLELPDQTSSPLWGKAGVGGIKAMETRS